MHHDNRPQVQRRLPCPFGNLPFAPLPFRTLLCHPTTLAPQLIIELDDKTHTRSDRKSRDDFVFVSFGNLPFAPLPSRSSSSSSSSSAASPPPQLTTPPPSNAISGRQ
ncbi:MAG: DUF2726 domain-containing protein [Phycisphaerae bacterium]|nr:DUF2726 domain-containing protein [Phycisphaerae bacterium]